MIAITFLGTGNYQETTYRLNDDRQFSTSLFPLAVNEFYQPDLFYVVMTEEAKKTNYAPLASLGRCKEIIIPNGSDDTEIWEMFDILVDNLPPGGEYLVDITHGFRSQPVMFLASAVFMKALKDIRFSHILYGAYEARDKKTNIAPVFELVEFLDLIEWTFAISRFNDAGDMRGLAGLLSNIETRSGEDAPRIEQLSRAGEIFSRLTDSFATLRLKEILDYSEKFSRKVKGLNRDFEKHPSSRPFQKLLESALEKLQPFSIASGMLFLESGINAQKEMISWYLKTEQYQQAVTLAREYLVTKYLVEYENLTEEKDITNYKKYREKAENTLHNWMELAKKKFSTSDRRTLYGEFWKNITDDRNNLNHAGINRYQINSKSADLKKSIEKNCAQIIKLI